MNPFDIVKNINAKSGLMSEDDVKGSMFMVNRALSNTLDTVLFANEANMLNDVPEIMKYHFLYCAVSKNPKRYAPWAKGPKDDDEHINNIMFIYNYSREKAEEVASLIDPEIVKQLAFKGGKK